MAIKARFPLLLLLLGIVFLALVCASSGISHPCHEKCLKRCNSVNDASSRHECRSRCEGWPERCEEEEQEEEEVRPWQKERGRRERGRQEGEREEEERQHDERGRRERGRQEGEKEEEERQHRQPHQSRPQEEEQGQQQRFGRRQTRHEREEEEEQEGPWQPRREREQEERQHRQSRPQQEEEGQQQQRPRQRQPRHEREEEEEEEGQWQPRRRRHEEDQEEEERRGHRRSEDPDERERVRIRRERRQEQEEEREERRRHRESEEEEGSSSSSSSSESQRRRNPFFFSSNTFQTLFENENGRIRLVQRFDKRSNLFQNLKNYRILEYRSKPRTLFLPQHNDADSILVVLNGRAIFTVVNPNNRNSFNLECGDAIQLPAGTTAYLANRDDNEDLRVVDLAIPVNGRGQFQSFFPSSSQNQQSYFNEFSRDILEASYNTNYKEIERVLLEEQQEGRQQRRGRRERQQSQEVNPIIVKVSREQIEELSKNAKSSSKKRSSSSESQPFNLRSQDPIYSNKFGRFFEITPEENPQLQNLGLSLSSVEIREGAIMLPHYNSRAFVILVINEGKGHIELVGQRNEQQQQEGEEEEEEQEQQRDKRSSQLQRHRARLSPGDIFVIPASNPVAVNASSDLNFIGFGINAENNQRNFLAGEDDNVISQLHRAVKELAFPGSAQEVERLLKNQRQSYFASAQPQQREEESQRRRGSLFSILDAFY